jgi:hypothetical protein
MTHLSVVHLHLAINHSPLYAELFAFFFTLAGLLRKNRGLVTSGLVICSVAALCAGAAYWSGDQASDLIDQSRPIAGLDKTLIGEHAGAAAWFLGAACVTAVLAIVALIVGRKRGERPRWLEVVVLLLILFSLTVVARTALLGGRIHHPEVRAVAGS